MPVPAFLTILLAAASWALQDDEIRARANEFSDGTEPVDTTAPAFRFFHGLFSAGLTEDQVKAKVERSILPAALLARPAAHRGRFVRLYGRMVRMSEEPLDDEKGSTVTVAYLQTWPGRQMVVLHLPRRPSVPFHVYRKNGREYIDDWVTVEGVFLRTYQYPGNPLSPKDPPPTIVSLVLFGRAIDLAPPPDQSSVRRMFILIVIVVAGLVMGLVLLGGILSRRRRPAPPPRSLKPSP